jgi:hypothetical protein
MVNREIDIEKLIDRLTDHVSVLKGVVLDIQSSQWSPSSFRLQLHKCLESQGTDLVESTTCARLRGRVRITYTGVAVVTVTFDEVQHVVHLIAITDFTSKKLHCSLKNL